MLNSKEQRSVFVTDSQVLSWGGGGNVVSYHELNALSQVSTVTQIYQRVGALFFEEHYPRNPFMYDYYIASLLKEPENIDLAHFYGSSFNLTAKRLFKARRFATVPAHNLEESLREWTSEFKDIWQPPPLHLTNDLLFRYLVHGLQDVTVITPSSTSAAYLKKKLGIDATIIPHGTDVPEVWTPEREPFKVLHISQFGPDKGQIYLLRAWNKIQDLPIQLNLCCLGLPETLINGVKNIALTNNISEAEKAELYKTSSVYVQSSVTEGWGLTVGEAMSYGTPVIVTEGTGASDMVTDGREGFIIPIRDPDAIAKALIYFYDNPLEVKRMGHNARITAEKYAWNRIEEKYAQVFLG